MMNYTKISSADMKTINGGGKYDKQGYQLGQTVGRVLGFGITIAGFFL